MDTLQESLTHSFYTKFYPSLQAFTGSAISTLIIGKLEYWFSVPQFVDGFYKFVEPCGHPLYREGDSWSEELGISRKLFTKAFDIIGVRYNSKSAFLKAEDPFRGKLYASYHDRRTNQTYYVRNHSFVMDFLKGLFTKKKLSSLNAQERKKEAIKERKNLHKVQNKKETEHLTQKTVFSSSSPSSSLSQGRSRNGNLGRSYARGSFSFQKKTSSLESSLSSISDLQVERNTEEMIKIWKEEVGELGVSSLSQGLLTRLQLAFKEFFEESLESWKAYCQMIASSKFLMGEAQNTFFKKAWMIWAIKGENIERIRAGGFKIGDRQTNQERKRESMDREIMNLENKKHQIEMKISNIKSEEHEKRIKMLKDKIKNISDPEKLLLEQEFEAHLEKENNSMTEEFRKSRWKGMFISVYFESFIKEKIYSELFNASDEAAHDEKIVQSSGLLERLDDICHELACLKHKKRDLFESRAQHLLSLGR